MKWACAVKPRIFKLRTVRSKPWAFRYPGAEFPVLFATFDEAVEAFLYVLWAEHRNYDYALSIFSRAVFKPSSEIRIVDQVFG